LLLSFLFISIALDKLDSKVVAVPGLDVGKRGLEKFFDTELRGKFGRKRNEVTSRGHVIDSQIYEQTSSGEDIQVSLDMSLQAFAMQRLEMGNYNLTSIQNKLINLRLIHKNILKCHLLILNLFDTHQ